MQTWLLTLCVSSLHTYLIFDDDLHVSETIRSQWIFRVGSRTQSSFPSLSSPLTLVRPRSTLFHIFIILPSQLLSGPRSPSPHSLSPHLGSPSCLISLIHIGMYLPFLRTGVHVCVCTDISWFKMVYLLFFFFNFTITGK